MFLAVSGRGEGAADDSQVIRAYTALNGGRAKSGPLTACACKENAVTSTICRMQTQGGKRDHRQRPKIGNHPPGPCWPAVPRCRCATSSRAALRQPNSTYKLATGQDPTHPVNIRAQEALDRIREATGGRLDIRLFPANQLGSDTDLLSQVRSGGRRVLQPVLVHSLDARARRPASSTPASPSRTTTPCGGRWTATSAPTSVPRSPSAAS